MSPAPSLVQDSDTSLSPLSLKVKGGKPFAVFSRLTDEDSLTRTWKVSSRVANELDQGHRIENLSWRLWHLRDVLVSGEKSKGEHTFNSVSRSIGRRLESDKKRDITELKTPIFRWTNRNDAVRHLGVERLQRRDDASRLKSTVQEFSQPERVNDDDEMESSRLDSSRHAKAKTGKSQNTTTVGVIRVKGKGRRETDRNQPSSDDSGSSSSSSPSASDTQVKRPFSHRHQRNKRSKKEHSQSTSPPVCWRLSKAAAEQQRRRESEVESAGETSKAGATHPTPDPVVSSTWTLEEIEAAEKELAEQGVELSGPFVAMLADLKRGELTKVKTEETTTSWPLDSLHQATAALRGILQPAQQQGALLKSAYNFFPHQYPSHQQHYQNNHSQQQLPPSQNHYPPSVRSSLHSLNLSSPFQFDSTSSTPVLPMQTSSTEAAQQLFNGISLPSSPANPLTAAAVGPSSSYSSPLNPVYGWTAQQQMQSSSFATQSSQHSRRDSIVSDKPSRQTTAAEKEEVNSVKGEEEVKEGLKPQCVNCGATSTPLWRRDSNFDLQCNACGLYMKLHKVPRPATLKHRRSEKKLKEISPTGSDPKEVRNPLRRRRSTTSSTKDEWMGIHAGSSCANCGTSTTPLWRKDSDGRIICNACGLYFKLHNSHRPIAMRMDAIKRRARFDDRSRKSIAVGNEGSSVTTPGDAMMLDYSSSTGSAKGSGILQQTHSHLINDGSMMQDSPLSGIQIPTELWENHLCPMGAWGENCCQNLPQPEEVIGGSHNLHLHHQQQSSSTSSGDQAMQTVDPTTMDSILGSDWLVNYGSISDPHHKVDSHFNSLAIHGNPEETIVGPSYPLRKRRAETLGTTTSEASPPVWWPLETLPVTSSTGDTTGADGSSSSSNPQQ